MWRCCIRRSTWLVVIIVAALAAGCVTTPEAPPPASRIAAFSATKPGEPIPPGWGPWSLSRFKSPSRYRLVEDAGTTVLLGDAQASASGLIHYLDVDPGERPLLSWRWKVMALATPRRAPTIRRRGSWFRLPATSGSCTLAHQDHRRREREGEAGEVPRKDAQRRGGLPAR